MHELFVQHLKNYQVDKRFLAPLKDQLLITYQKLTTSAVENSRALRQSLSSVSKKLETAEERYALGEIERDIFEKIGGKLKAEKRLLRKIGQRKKNIEPARLH